MSFSANFVRRKYLRRKCPRRKFRSAQVSYSPLCNKNPFTFLLLVVYASLLRSSLTNFDAEIRNWAAQATAETGRFCDCALGLDVHRSVHVLSTLGLFHRLLFLLGLFDYSWWVFAMQRNFRNKKPDFQLPYVYKAKVIMIEQKGMFRKFHT